MSTVIDIVTADSRGLRRSAEMVDSALSRDYRTRIHVLRPDKIRGLRLCLPRSLERRLFRPERIVIFLELVPAAGLDLACRAILIPNQEWMWPETVQNLPRCAQVWCKTRYAENIFREKGYDTRFIGFSSKDVCLPGQPKDYNRFIHVAGKSQMKGTRTVVELWHKHPEWPRLLVVTSEAAYREAANISIRNDLPESELYARMNECGVHLCPSEAEGFGHYISEALSTRALVITTDAPPMNEVVKPEYGLLARYRKAEPEGFGERFFVDSEDLERRIEAALRMSAAGKARIGEAARQAYLKRDAAFPRLLLAAVNELPAVSPPASGRQEPRLRRRFQV